MMRNILKTVMLSIVFTFFFSCIPLPPPVEPPTPPDMMGEAWCEENDAESNLWKLMFTEDSKCEKVWGGVWCPSGPETLSE